MPTDEHNEDQAFMRIALEEAARAPAIGEVPIGAVVVRGGQILAQAQLSRTLAGPHGPCRDHCDPRRSDHTWHVAVDRDDTLRDRRALHDVYRCDYPSENSPSCLWGMGSESRRLRIGV